MTEEKIMEIKRKIREEAERKFPGDDKRQNAYIWGTIQEIKNRSSSKS